MNESALEGFVKIVELNSFSAAAEALYLSQSALSQQIRTLEGQLQFELFQHVPRRVVLTPAGQDFYPKAKQLVALYQQALRHARAVQQQEKLILQNVQKLLTWMQSMTQFMRWQEMRHVTEEHSKDFLRDILDRNDLI